MDLQTLQQKELELERKTLSLERERLDFEKTHVAKQRIFQKHPVAVITAILSIITVVVSATQVFTAHLAKSREMEISQFQNKEQNDRQWRIALLEFLDKNQTKLASKDPNIREMTLSMLEVSFPTKYARPVRSKLAITSAATRLIEDIAVQERSGYKKKIYTELLVPLVDCFDKTKEAFKYYTTSGTKWEKQLLEGNIKARDLLVNKSELIPKNLRSDALRLVEHYEAWLAKYDTVRSTNMTHQQQTVSSSHLVFVGPEGYPFPTEAETRFRNLYKEYRQEFGD